MRMESSAALCRLPCLGRLSAEMGLGFAKLAVPPEEVGRCLPLEARYPQLRPRCHLLEAILRQQSVQRIQGLSRVGLDLGVEMGCQRHRISSRPRQTTVLSIVCMQFRYARAEILTVVHIVGTEGYFVVLTISLVILCTTH